MKPEDIQKLLGGYATGTLTREEQQALFAAALDDQQLFDALAKEQSLRDLLRDPAARAHVLAAMDERPLPWWRRGPGLVVLAGATLAACLAVAGVYLVWQKAEVKPVLMAVSKPPELTAPIAAEQAPKAESPQTMPAARPAAVPVRQHPAPVKRPDSLPEPVGSAAPRLFTPFAPVSPASPPVAPPPVSTDSVEVTATAQNLVVNGSSSGSLRAENARALFYGAGSQFVPSPAQTPVIARPTPNLGVKWTALRKDAEGLFTEVDPAQIHAGDTIKLRLVPNDNGYLSVMDGSRSLVAERRVTGLLPVETPEITSDAGKKELTVLLARRPAVQQSAKAAAPVFRSADQAEHAVYEVAAGGNIFQPVTVKITLNFQ